jgi:hypothetical protein
VRKLGLLVLLVGNVMWFAACGGSGGGGSSSVTGVSVSCSPSTVGSGGTSQCSAVVSGTGNFSSSVTWSSTPPGINATTGLLMAPTVTTNTTVTVTATSTQNTTITGTANVTVTPSTTVSNVAPIVVDGGPPAAGGTQNIAFVTVTVCIPGGACQTIDHVQVDTGSEGLRLLSSASGGEFNPSGFTQETIGGNPLDECLVFEDGYVWGPVYTAQVTVAGETASGVPIQVTIPASSSPGVPNTCLIQNPSGGAGNEGGSVMAFGANGLIGVGLFVNDCGPYCVSDGASCNGTISAPCIYYTCVSNSCTASNVAQAQQVPNPVTLFATDNNGVLINFSTTVGDGGAPTANGSLIFGIGTQSNNGLGLAANIYPVPDQGNDAGNIITTYNGNSYPTSFLDSGSNGLYFLNNSLTGIALCGSSGNNADYYCPSNSPDSVTVTNQGQDSNGNPIGPSAQATFMVENALNLFNSGNTAFSTLAGPFFSGCGTGSNPACAFDFGLSFFYGKNVFTAIDNASTPGGTGPFFAY